MIQWLAYGRYKKSPHMEFHRIPSSSGILSGLKWRTKGQEGQVQIATSRGAPLTIAFSWRPHNSNFSLVYTHYYSFHGVYKPTNITFGGPTLNLSEWGLSESGRSIFVVTHLAWRTVMATQRAPKFMWQTATLGIWSFPKMVPLKSSSYY